MTNSQLLRLVRTYINTAWKAEERVLRHGSAYYPRKIEYDGVIKALDMLSKNLDKEQEQAKQPTLGELQ